MYHIFFIYSSVDGHLGCFHVLAIVTVLQWTSGYTCLFELWFSEDICPVVRSLDFILAYEKMGVYFPSLKKLAYYLVLLID